MPSDAARKRSWVAWSDFFNRVRGRARLGERDSGVATGQRAVASPRPIPSYARWPPPAPRGHPAELPTPGGASVLRSIGTGAACLEAPEVAWGAVRSGVCGLLAIAAYAPELLHRWSDLLRGAVVVEAISRPLARVLGVERPVGLLLALVLVEHSTRRGG